MTIAFYLGTLFLVLIGLTSAPQSLISGLSTRAFGMSFLQIGALLGGLLTWIIINFLWVKIEGGPIPLLLIGLTLIIMGIILTRKSLNMLARKNLIAEMWSIIIIGIYIVFQFDYIRWY